MAARCREVFILEDLKDTNIVQFMGACFEEGSAMLVTEFMAGGNLFDAIGNDRSGKLGWYQRCAHPSQDLGLYCLARGRRWLVPGSACMCVPGFCLWSAGALKTALYSGRGMSGTAAA